MNPPSPPPASGHMPTFGAVWLGQFISRLGSSLTTFALGALVYQTSGSVFRFALFGFFAALPMVLLSPFAGVFADRWDRRKLMLLGDLGAGFGIFLIWGLFAGQDAGWWTIQDWYYYPPVFLSSTCATLSYPAWISTVPLLVPRQHLGRASGLTELGGAVSQIAGPLIATSLLGAIGMRGILLIDVASYLFSVGVLLWVRFPAPPAAKATGPRSLKADLAEAWNFIRDRPGLRGLLAFTTSDAFTVCMVLLLINPLVLAFTDLDSLKWIASIAGMGGLLGGLVTSVWGGPRRRIVGLAGFSTLGALVLMLAALPPSVPLIAAAAAVFLFTFPLITSSIQVIWQLKVPPGLQGRVAALRRVVFQGTNLVAILLGGVLADRLFEPLLVPGGALAGSVGRVIGTGQGRGVAFMFIMLGLLLLGSVVWLWLSPRVRNVEAELPDALPSHPVASPQAVPPPAAVAGAEPSPSLAASGGPRT